MEDPRLLSCVPCPVLFTTLSHPPCTQSPSPRLCRSSSSSTFFSYLHLHGESQTPTLTLGVRNNIGGANINHDDTMMLIAPSPASVYQHPHTSGPVQVQQYLHATSAAVVRNAPPAVEVSGLVRTASVVQSAAGVVGVQAEKMQAQMVCVGPGMPPLTECGEALASASAAEALLQLPAAARPTVVPQQQQVESPELLRERALASQVCVGWFVRAFLALTATCSCFRFFRYWRHEARPSCVAASHERICAIQARSERYAAFLASTMIATH